MINFRPFKWTWGRVPPDPSSGPGDESPRGPRLSQGRLVLRPHPVCAPDGEGAPTFSLKHARKSLFISVTATLSCGLLGPLTDATIEFRLIWITWEVREKGEENSRAPKDRLQFKHYFLRQTVHSCV